ncbi:MAG: DNA methyltransferase [Alphaproteobacteria bacterium]
MPTSPTSNLENRIIFCKDNLEILQGINSNCIDLIYLDPPFNKNKTFTAPIGSSAEGASFKDIFTEKDIKEEWVETIKEDNEKLFHFLNGIKNIEGKRSYNFCYLVYMAIRLIEMHRILKDTGSVYYHCDPKMSHYIKITMDCIFGEKNFRNEIIWWYDTGGMAKSDFSRKHDTIFRYIKSNKWVFNADTIKTEKNEKQKQRFELAKKWGGDSTYRLTDTKKYPHDVIQIHAINPKAKERTKYPTQKPIALLELIIKVSSNEDDMVLDPFCGCATTCIAAEKLNRKWVGIDVSIKAYELVKERIKKEIKPEQPKFWDDKKINFFTSPPQRTDDGKNYIPKKWVYIISHKRDKKFFKVGIASDWKARLNSYQTADAERSYKIEYKLLTTKYRETEKHIHQKFDSKYEWVNGDLKDIIAEIENFQTL